MSYYLIVLLGNDQLLKNSIYENFQGKEQKNQSIFLPYSSSIPKNIDQDQHWSILNTPSAINYEDLISIWNNLIQISKLENIDYGTVIYCFKDYQSKLEDLLDQIHDQIGCWNRKNGIIIEKQFQLEYIFSKIKINKNFNFKNLTPKNNEECYIKKIAQEKINIILKEWNQTISRSNNLANFIQQIIEKQNLDNILDKLNLSTFSEIRMFNLAVNIRYMLDEKRRIFTNYLRFKSQEYSKFLYCTNKCKLLYVQTKFYQLEQIFQIDISLKPSTLTNYNCPNCPKCQEKTKFINPQQIEESIFFYFQKEIIYEIIQKQQQNQEILQIMLLSNEDEEKTKFFNMIQQNDSISNSKQQDAFVQSKLINEKYIFHNPPLLDFVNDSQSIISGYREYFQKNDIHFFFIFVNHQRIDIMTQRISNIIKKFHSLERQRMALIVNSQKQIQQGQHTEIVKQLNYFGFKSINFLNTSDSQQNIKKMIFKCLENIDLRKFDFTNTIFEQVDERMTQQFKENLNKVSKKIQEEELNRFKIYLDQEKQEIEKEKIEVQKLESFLKNKKDQLNQREQNYQLGLNEYKITQKKLNF
ncbi:unnamed protein product [Paramecium sonneborni]|uniref:Uncharacterized protein n=1 Tax=Paramecium sonneborni TaxID=65129 RepID=A0A8S1RF50_9CILI|nr:unnamed protein product [Paramecium sonneborni]